MHFFGGVVIALGVFTMHDLRLFISKRYLKLLSVLLVVFTIALVWEAYELYIGTPIEDNFLVDTFTDLGMGILGGLVGYGIGTNIKKL